MPGVAAILGSETLILPVGVGERVGVFVVVLVCDGDAVGVSVLVDVIIGDADAVGVFVIVSVGVGVSVFVGVPCGTTFPLIVIAIGSPSLKTKPGWKFMPGSV